MGWLESIEAEKHEVKFSPQARMQIEWLKEQGVQELENFLLQQLQYDPLNSKKKRLSQITDSAAVLAYRTWRAHFSFHERQIQVCEIFSGYSHDDLKNPADLYHDKEIHRRFLEEFKNFC